jgi:plastocyanin
MVVLALGTAFGATACGDDDKGDGGAQSSTSPPPDQRSADGGAGQSNSGGGTSGAGRSKENSTAARGGTREQVAMREYKFEPKNLVVKYGSTITVTNEGEVAHNLTIERGPNPRIRSEKLTGTSTFIGGGSEPLQIRLPPGRRYSMICTVPGHRELGMVGTVRVKP